MIGGGGWEEIVLKRSKGAYQFRWLVPNLWSADHRWSARPWEVVLGVSEKKRLPTIISGVLPNACSPTDYQSGRRTDFLHPPLKCRLWLWESVFWFRLIAVLCMQSAHSPICLAISHHDCWGHPAREQDHQLARIMNITFSGSIALLLNWLYLPLAASHWQHCIMTSLCPVDELVGDSCLTGSQIKSNTVSKTGDFLLEGFSLCNLLDRLYYISRHEPLSASF